MVGKLARMMLKPLLIALLIVVVLAVVGSFLPDPEDTNTTSANTEGKQASWAPTVSRPKVKLVQLGYYKDDQRFRVMAFRAQRKITQDELWKALYTIPHTRGSTTWAVVYGPKAKAPSEQLTSTKHRARAVRLVFSPPFDRWQWYLFVRHDGVRIVTGKDENGSVHTKEMFKAINH